MPGGLETVAIVVPLVMGGILKGATGIGAPIFAVPAIASVFDVPFAIAIMVLPNFVMNVWQVWHFRKDAPAPAFLAVLAGGGLAGVLAGTLMLAWIPGKILSLAVAILLLAYIGIRLLHPHWSLGPRAGRWLAGPVGLVGGVLQGATGLSAPATLTFLNALRMKRPMFIFTISSLFTAFGVVQLPALFAVGVLDTHRLLISALAILPTTLSMPLGALIARRLSPAVFDRIIIVALAAIALKLLVESVASV